MGNVKSFCCKDTDSDCDDREERSRILNDNCNGSCNDLYNGSTTSAYSHQDSVSYGSMNNGHGSKTMEQSALDKIYQKMAANVIDVAPGESMVIQQAEFIERQKAYQAKLNQIKTPLPLKLTNRLPKHLNNSSFDTTMSTHSPSSTAAMSSLGITNITTSSNNSSNHLTPGNTTSSTNSNSPQHVNKSQEKRRVEYEPISVDDIQLINDISKRSIQALKSLKITSKEQVVANFKP